MFFYCMYYVTNDIIYTLYNNIFYFFIAAFKHLYFYLLNFLFTNLFLDINVIIKPR